MSRCPLCPSEGSAKEHACVVELPIGTAIEHASRFARERDAHAECAEAPDFALCAARGALEGLYAAVCERGAFVEPGGAAGRGAPRCTFCGAHGPTAMTIAHRADCAFARTAVVLGHFVVAAEGGSADGGSADPLLVLDEMARRHLGPQADVELRVMRDPDSGGRPEVVADIYVSMPVPEARERFERLEPEWWAWVDAAKGPASEWIVGLRFR